MKEAQVNYCYPSSPMAEKLHRADIGAWYYTVAKRHQHHRAEPQGVSDSREETAAKMRADLADTVITRFID